MNENSPTPFRSNMPPEQAKSLFASFAITVLNELSVKMKQDISAIKLQVNCKTNKIDFWMNNEPTPAASVMMVSEFTSGIMPCIEGEKKAHDVETIDAYVLEITKEKFQLDIYGKNTAGERLTFDLSPLQIIPYLNKK